ncbi:hypothetical protein PC119_g6021 [Phytophthora cactorum]|uniref:Uncharacterized protein n=1 Tax=Phytophthora cactorum TaxID=29920 RepID=A0A8T0YR42_9STRA|nr:hypothetical protein PC113_g17287 [Phytophthora cactorum]KAG2889873.1 hypothetical protein PC117_g24606 [Phytophthora cactorum]KAG2903661.1 hypothetical protein PC114_g12158 [Phytophthora cactorum]KAG3031216.1 hypothetical protein PC119_g6021 [Phytophthora cactorum]KAG3126215.1 hypothetical protein C6341_g25461 [Phytophthora cactorum]
MQDHTHQLCDSLQKMFAGKDRVAVKQVRLRMSPRVHKRWPVKKLHFFSVSVTRALSDSVPACLVKRVRRRQTIALVMARDRASPVR